jgi:hypothetical protein
LKADLLGLDWMSAKSKAAHPVAFGSFRTTFASDKPSFIQFFEAKNYGS